VDQIHHGPCEPDVPSTLPCDPTSDPNCLPIPSCDPSVDPSCGNDDPYNDPADEPAEVSDNENEGIDVGEVDEVNDNNDIANESDIE